MERIQIVLLLFAAFSLSCVATDQSGDDRDTKNRLLRDLLYSRNYDSDVEPPLENGAINVTFGLGLLCVTPVDDYVSVETWTRLTWKDVRLSWDPSAVDGVDSLRVNPYRIWKPDLRLYNAYKTDVTDTMAIVMHDGTVWWIPPVNYLVRCQHADNATTYCSLKFGSWAYSSNIVDILGRESYTVDLSIYLEACPSIVQSHESIRNVNYYLDVEEPFADVTIILQLAWR